MYDLAFWDREPRDAQGQWTRLAGLMHASGGFTSINGEEATSGYAVAVPAKGGKDWATLPHGSTTAADIEKFARKHQKELAVPGRGIGGWSNDNPEYGDVRDALDIVHVYDDDVAAAHAAYAGSQDAFYDLKAGREVTVKEVFDRLRPDPNSPEQLAKKAANEADQTRRSKAYVAAINKHPMTAGLKGIKYGGHYMEKEMRDMSVHTPVLKGQYDLSLEDGKLAFWKQVLPERIVHYTAKDGSRQVLDFNRQFLTDLSHNKAVDKVGFLLADVNNAHTMDPERWRGEIAEWAIRDNEPDPDHNGLWGKIVFPNKEAAHAVLSNPDLGVSARIREGIAKDDGSLVSRGIVHVLGTLDPQIGGMSPWQATDLSSEQDDLLDLTSETYEDGSTMAQNERSTADYTEAEIEAMTDDEFKDYLARFEAEFEGILDSVDENETVETQTETRELASLSNEAQSQIDLANSKASDALKRLAKAEWEKTRDRYLSAGVAPADLDLAEPIFNRPSEFVVDLSNEGTEGTVDVAKIVRGLLDSLKGTIDLSAETGHSGTFKSGDGEDPDAQLLGVWDSMS